VRAGTALKTELTNLDTMESWGGLRVLEPERSDPLRECVRSALRYYLEKMSGHEVVGLYRLVLDEVERPMIETVLESTNNNQTVAARMLGMSRSTLRKKLKAFGLDGA
jgi:Fis family transcriptional regulator